MDHYIEEFKLSLLSSSRAISTAIAYECAVKELIKALTFRENCSAWSDVTPRMIERHMQEQSRLYPFVAAIRRRRAALKVWIAFCAYKKIVAFDIHDIVWPELTQATVVQHQHTALVSQRDRLLQALLQETPLKLSDIITLAEHNLDPLHQHILIQHDQKTRAIALRGALFRELLAYAQTIPNGSLLFPFNRRALAQFIRRIKLSTQTIATTNAPAVSQPQGLTHYKNYHPRK